MSAGGDQAAIVATTLCAPKHRRKRRRSTRPAWVQVVHQCCAIVGSFRSDILYPRYYNSFADPCGLMPRFSSGPRPPKWLTWHRRSRRLQTSIRCPPRRCFVKAFELKTGDGHNPRFLRQQPSQRNLGRRGVVLRSMRSSRSITARFALIASGVAGCGCGYRRSKVAFSSILPVR